MKLLEEVQINYQKHMKSREYPACFENNKKFKDWQEMETLANTKPRELPCRDCTITYYSKAVVEGRCPQSNVKSISRLFNKSL